MSTGKILGEKYKISNVIGQGGFSTVYSCIDLHSGKQYAVKVLNKAKVRELCMEDAFERETNALRCLRYSPYVTNVVDVLESTRNYYIITDIANHGTLLHMIVRGGGLSRPVARKYFRQLLQGLKDIHSSNVVHRDIKPDNLLLDQWRDIKISDFGFAAYCKPERVLTRQCGTPQYVAPEVLQGKYYGRDIDIWSAGVSLYVMLFGQMPFVAANPERLYQMISIGKFKLPKKDGRNIATPAVSHLLGVMLRVDPTKRWCLQKIMKHPWVLGREELPSAIPRPIQQKMMEEVTSLEGGSHVPQQQKSPNSYISPDSIVAGFQNSSFAFSPDQELENVSSEKFRNSATARDDVEYEEDEGLMKSAEEELSTFGSHVAPSLSCPDLRTLFLLRNATVDPLRDSFRSRNFLRGGSSLLAAPRDVSAPNDNGRGVPPPPSRSPALQPPAPVVSPRPRSTPSRTKTPDVVIEANDTRFQSLTRRLGLVHIKICVNFVSMVTLVLIAGVLRVLFNMDINKLPMPTWVRNLIESILEPPKQLKPPTTATPVVNTGRRSAGNHNRTSSGVSSGGVTSTARERGSVRGLRRNSSNALLCGGTPTGGRSQDDIYFQTVIPALGIADESKKNV